MAVHHCALNSSFAVADALLETMEARPASPQELTFAYLGYVAWGSGKEDGFARCLRAIDKTRELLQRPASRW
jgi:hypothetical protein